MNRKQKRVAAKGVRPAQPDRTGAEALHQQGIAAYRAGRHAEAAQLIAAAIREGGETPDYLCNLGVVQKAGGDPAAALETFEQALRLDPRHVLALGNRGNVLAQAGRLAEAAASYRAALAVSPHNAGIENNLGNVLRQLGDIEEAAAAYRRAIALVPGYVEALSNLGSLLVRSGDLDAAISHLERALTLQPRSGAAHANLGSAFAAKQEYRRAEEHYRAAVAVAPRLPVAHSGLGDVLRHLGQPAAAAESYRAALRLAPSDPATLSALLFLSNYDSRTTAAQMAGVARTYGEVVSRGVVAEGRHANVPDPGKRLKVGLVSGDLRAHAVSSFLRNLLPELDPSQIELFAYATSALKDDTTAEMQRHFAHWRDAATLGDAALCRAIIDDGIDILVDLSGHTLFNRLPAFARKPAPVQVTWLGYSGTTGVGAIDYILGDRWVTPEGEAAACAEKPWRMPNSYLCFTPPSAALPVGPLPAGADGPITFGSFNNLGKLSDLTVGVWAGVLDAVPGSRLLLKHRMLEDSAVAAEAAARFAAHGVAPGRLLIRGRDPSAEQHLRTYDLVDIALDPFPYNGTTTTVEALWMGVPVLALRGDRFIARVGESILRTAGLGEWVARDPAAYVAKAAAFATGRQELARLRGRLRPQLLASPLCDAPRFARDLEGAFRGMWTAWCEARR